MRSVGDTRVYQIMERKQMLAKLVISTGFEKTELEKHLKDNPEFVQDIVEAFNHAEISKSPDDIKIVRARRVRA